MLLESRGFNKTEITNLLDELVKQVTPNDRKHIVDFRIPTAKIVSEVYGVYTLEAESYGTGVEMWLRTQGEHVKITK